MSHRAAKRLNLAAFEPQAAIYQGATQQRPHSRRKPAMQPLKIKAG